MGLHHHRKKAVPASGRRFENAAEGGYTFVIAPPTLISAALRFIFRRVSLKSCLFCNYRETTLPICRSVWSGFAFFGHSPLQDDEWVWSGFAFFDSSTLQDDEWVWSGFALFDGSPPQDRERVWSGFALFGNSPLQDDEWVWSGFVFFGHSPLQHKEPAFGRRFENAAEGGYTFVIAPPTADPAALRFPTAPMVFPASLR
ncbi:hypothetical protein [Murdochiella massiliensis]|uniref:hypothetical protein n=1 Tax=Murdochiella massiliensis TaxID=1673723 RepID=UPI00082AA60B|nr:hypothetical protein [Murdochiella massiliensis]